jgi:hypothetical protein
VENALVTHANLTPFLPENCAVLLDATVHEYKSLGNLAISMNIQAGPACALVYDRAIDRRAAKVCENLALA